MTICRCWPKGRLCGNPYCNWAAKRDFPGWRPSRHGPQVFGFRRSGKMLAVTAFSREEARAKLFFDWDVHCYAYEAGPDAEIDL